VGLPVQWIEMQAPAPRIGYQEDTFLVSRARLMGMRLTSM
jgi:hypothetical protein